MTLQVCSGPLRRAVFLVGGSGTGKSRLAKYLAQHCSVELIPGQATSLATLFGGFEQIHNDLDAANRFQRALFQATVSAIFRAYAECQVFIAERSIDYLVYSSRYTTDTMTTWRSSETAKLLDLMRDNCVVFCRYNPDILRAAAQSDEGRRNRFLTTDWALRLDSAIEFILESNAVPYVSLEGSSFHTRVRSVLAYASR